MVRSAVPLPSPYDRWPTYGTHGGGRAGAVDDRGAVDSYATASRLSRQLIDDTQSILRQPLALLCKNYAPIACTTFRMMRCEIAYLARPSLRMKSANIGLEQAAQLTTELLGIRPRRLRVRSQGRRGCVDASYQLPIEPDLRYDHVGALAVTVDACAR